MTDSVKKKKGLSFYILVCVGCAALILFDRLTKWLAVENLMDKPDFIMAEGILRLRYLENRGAAWGMLQNSQVLFTVLTIVFLALIVWYFIRVPAEKKYKAANVCLTFLAAGALGNFIDRITQQYVVDFIYFECINFPIFNVADIYVSLSVIVFVLLVIFYYKDGDFRFLFKRREKQHD